VLRFWLFVNCGVMFANGLGGDDKASLNTILFVPLHP
jgi:hypothetical protein